MTRQMVDSAFPLGSPPKGGWPDTILIYAGGDTPHPWTTKEILEMPARYRWPCWVRSDPQGSRQAGTDACSFVAWLHGHHVPMATSVILDLEEAVNTAYVKTFNVIMRDAGYLVTKYGAQNFIWGNPPTDGGTFVALPGSDVLTTEGDTVARQYAFDGRYDLSILKDEDELPLWDTRPPLVAKNPVTGLHVIRRGWTTVTLGWDAHDGDSDYLVYPVSLRANSQKVKVPEARVRHLHRKTTYDFRVRAQPGATGALDANITVTTR